MIMILAGLYLYTHFWIDKIFIFPYVYNGVSCCRNLHRLFFYIRSEENEIIKFIQKEKS